MVSHPSRLAKSRQLMLGSRFANTTFQYRIHFMQDVSVPEDAKDFIRKILVLDPKMRPTLD